MKITLEELRPNPYRDSAHYPIHREKVEALKASIRSTGFWDNLVARKAPNNGHYEIAYGHHRLEALRELISEKALEADLPLELSVRKLDDAAMIRMMANENGEVYRVTSDIIDETVRVAREYIQQQTKTPLNDITASDISQFLGGSWSEERVAVALQRLGLFDRGTVRREQFKGLSHTAAKSIQREAAKIEKAMTKAKLARQDDDEELSAQERQHIRAQVQKAAGHVAQVLADHVRGGGAIGEVKEKSLEAQAELIPEDAPPEERKLSTIDAAVQAVNAREFQRKIELLLRYQAYMAEESKEDLAAKLKALASWCKETLSTLET